ncbi:membrane dipeptidase [Actinomadura rubteroloni]|uniref:membrane dipeptidase n=1 Tax=Actinomadura rubteroloni TaxID=1926885 RepID=UPI0038B3642F
MTTCRSRCASCVAARSPTWTRGSRLRTDLLRLRAGQVAGQLWSVFVPTGLEPGAAVQMALEQLNLVHRLVARHPDVLRPGVPAGWDAALVSAGCGGDGVGQAGGTRRAAKTSSRRRWKPKDS